MKNVLKKVLNVRHVKSVELVSVDVVRNGKSETKEVYAVDIVYKDGTVDVGDELSQADAEALYDRLKTQMYDLKQALEIK